MTDIEAFLAFFEREGATIYPWQRNLLKQFFDPANKDKHLKWVYGRRGGRWMWVDRPPKA